MLRRMELLLGYEKKSLAVSHRRKDRAPRHEVRLPSGEFRLDRSTRFSASRQESLDRRCVADQMQLTNVRAGPEKCRLSRIRCVEYILVRSFFSQARNCSA